MTMQRITEVCPKYLSETAESVVPGGYKQTEIGVIPEDWELLPMSHLTTLMTNGFVGTAKSHYTDSQHGITYIQGYNVEENGFNYHGIKKVTPEFHKKNAKSCLRTGDVLMVQTGDVGLVTIVPPELEGANCHALIINRFKPEYDSKYFAFLLNSTQGRQRLKELEIGTTMKHINVGDLLHFTVPFPKVKKEQTAIATALSDVDALITELEKLIIKKQAIKTATMQQLLTGRTRLPQFALREDGSKKGYKQSELGEIPEDWEICELKDAVDFLDGLRRPVKSGDRAKISGIYPYYGASGIVDYVNDFIFDDELILLGEDGENILSRNLPLAFKVSGKIWVNNHAHVMKPKSDFDITYLTEFLESLDYSLLNSGTAQPKLNKQSCLKIKVAKPSKKEQSAIAIILSDMDDELRALEQRLNKNRQIKQGMMQELLTGKTRLVKPEDDHHGSA